jgi:hypothetical protein
MWALTKVHDFNVGVFGGSACFVMVQALYVGFKDGFDALSFIGERFGKLNGTRHNRFQSMVR